MPKIAIRTRSIRQAHWLAITAVLAFAFVAALVLYSVAPAANDREVRAQGGNTIRTDVTVIPRPPVETPDDADRTAPSPNDGRRTIVAPPYPDYPNGSITGVGSVALDWDDVPTALSYAVQVHTGTGWTLLPWNDVTIQFSGSSAQIDGLPNYDTYYLRVRAANSAGNSSWSGFAVIVNDTSNQATSTPTPTPTPDSGPTATPTPSPTPTAEATATSIPTASPTATATATLTSTLTPTSTVSEPIIAPPPGSCHLLGATMPNTRSADGCNYPKLRPWLASDVCEYEAEQRKRGEGGADANNEDTIPRVSVHVYLVDGADPQGVLDWIAARDGPGKFNLSLWQPAEGSRVNWYAPLSLLGQLSQRDDVRTIFEFAQLEPEPQNQRSTGSSSSDAAVYHGADVWHDLVDQLGATMPNTRSADGCNYPKLRPWLASDVCEYEAEQRKRGEGGADANNEDTIPRVSVHVYLVDGADPQGVLDWIAARDGPGKFNLSLWQPAEGSRVNWYAPLSLLGQLSQRDDVRTIFEFAQLEPEPQNQRSTGSSSSDAAVYHGADVWHDLVDQIDGTGVKVGILDTGFDGLWDFLRTQGTVTPPPANCTFGIGSHLCEPDAEGAPEAHGAWVAEAMLDISPGAELYIARVSETQSFSDAVESLVTQNVDVINASLGALFDTGTPGSPQDDMSILSSLEEATSAGTTWVNSAGNYASAERNFFVLLPRGQSRQDDYSDDWLQMAGPGIDFNKAIIGEETDEGDFRMRWGNLDDSDPALLSLYLCDNNGCTRNRKIGADLRPDVTVKVADWVSGVGTSTPVYLRVCRDPGGGFPSWVQIGASAHTKFETSSDKFRTVNGIAESDSPRMLAVGAADASGSGGIDRGNSSGNRQIRKSRKSHLVCQQVVRQHPIPTRPVATLGLLGSRRQQPFRRHSD